MVVVKFMLKIKMNGRNRNHPIDRSWIYKQITLNWCKEELRKSTGTHVYQQSDHFDLPKKSNVRSNLSRLEAAFAQKKDLWKAIVKVYWLETLWVFTVSAVAQALLQSYPLVLGALIGDLRAGRTDSREDQIRIGWYFGFLVVSTLLSGILSNYTNFRLSEMSLRISNSVMCLVFKKALRFNVMNKTEHSSGTITNYVQLDAQKISELMKGIQLSSTLLSFGLGVGLIYYRIGHLVWTIVAAFVLGMVLVLYFTKLRVKLTSKLMEAKDARVQSLTNVINNIKFIKIKAWENFFHYKVAVKREVELRYLFYMMIFNSGAIFLNWFCNSNLQIVFVVVITYFNPRFVTLVNISSTLAVLRIFFDVQMTIPWVTAALIDLKVSLGRTNKFLAAEELNPDRLSFVPVEAELACKIEDGDFAWFEESPKQTEKQTGSRKLLIKKSMIEQSLLDQPQAEQQPKKVAFRISNISFSAKRGSLVFVVGSIGSGKSSLLLSLCGEMDANREAAFRPSVQIAGKVALLTQHPWMLGSTIRDNILLDLPEDPAKLERAIRLSQLVEDLREMPDGLETFVGENGQTVSGGQRTRIALARCIYQDPDIFVLDDPLSALDLKVADKIMREGICGELKDKTRIISTHAIHNLRFADKIYVMDQASFVFEGTWEEFQATSMHQDFKRVTEQYSVPNYQEPGESSTADTPTEEVKPRKEPNRGEQGSERSSSLLQTKVLKVEDLKEQNEQQSSLVNKLFLEEDRVEGGIKATTVATFLREVGGVMPILLIMSSVAMLLAADLMSDYYHIEWAKNFDPNKKYDYLPLLIFLLFSRSLLASIRSLLVFGTQLLLSRNMHAKMMFRILHAKIGQFLERVPAGRIINRFTREVDVVDLEIGGPLSRFYLNFGSVLLNSFILVWTVGLGLVGPILVFLVVGTYYQRKVMKAKREVVRLQGISRSPMISSLFSLLKGLSEIRLLEKQKFVFDEFLLKTEDNLKNNILAVALDNWYTIHINFINVFLIQLPGFCIIAYFIYLSESPLPIEKVILFVFRSMSMSADLMGMLLSFGLIETQLISVERCSAFSKIEPEDRYLNFAVHERKFLHPTSPAVLKKIIADMADSGFRPIPRGRVEFRGVTARYPSKALPALQDLNLQVAPGEKVGIVGRTGAGKTSLIKLFWMCLEPSQGKVYIDGRDVMRLDLKTLRASMDIISQDTAIFEGTLRENLDPKLEYLHDKSSPEFKEKDRQLLEKVVSMGFTAEDLEDKGLDYPISSGGSNLSLGQKQLLSFIRILIDPKKLMILDEATANIDLKTERLMQDAVKNEFKGNTMFIIAHRIQTVLDCDKICVMEAGRIVEYGTPKDLLAAENSRFAEIFKKLQENNDES